MNVSMVPSGDMVTTPSRTATLPPGDGVAVNLRQRQSIALGIGIVGQDVRDKDGMPVEVIVPISSTLPPVRH